MDGQAEFQLTCDCGALITARSERQLLEEMVRHAGTKHGMNLSTDQARDLLRREDGGPELCRSDEEA